MKTFGNIAAVFAALFGIFTLVFATYCACKGETILAISNYVFGIVDIVSAVVIYLSTRPL